MPEEVEEIGRILLNIIKFIQTLLIYGSIAALIYLGILAYMKKYDELKKNIVWVLLGLAVLIAAYTIPVLILSFLGKPVI